MKPYLYLFISLAFMACSKNSVDENCNFIPNIGVNESFNLVFEPFSRLSIGTSIYVPNYGYRGIFITNTGSGYVAFEATDPNHIPSPCSKLTLSGNNAICGCEDANTYNLFTGLPVNNSKLRCRLKEYRAEKTGNTLRVYN